MLISLPAPPPVEAGEIFNQVSSAERGTPVAVARTECRKNKVASLVRAPAHVRLR